MTNKITLKMEAKFRLTKRDTQPYIHVDRNLPNHHCQDRTKQFLVYYNKYMYSVIVGCDFKTCAGRMHSRCS
jgi:hypothetical protein